MEILLQSLYALTNFYQTNPISNFLPLLSPLHIIKTSLSYWPGYVVHCLPMKIRKEVTRMQTQIMLNTEPMEY